MKDGILTKVIGVSHKNDDGSSRQRYIKRYCEKGARLALIPEPDNPYDPNAIKVLIQQEKGAVFQIGYLDKRLAGDVTREMENGTNFYGIVSQVTGGTSDKPTRGVNFKLHKTFVDQKQRIAGKPQKDNFESVHAKSKTFGNTLAIIVILVLSLLILGACAVALISIL